jgi:hypothetical protein
MYKNTEIYFQINWREYINARLSVTSDHTTVDDEEKVIVYAPEYLKNLNTLLDNMQKTDDGKLYAFFASIVDHLHGVFKFEKILSSNY